MEDLSTDYLRKHLGEVFDRVQYAGEQYVVKRKGREIGAIVPVELFRSLQRAARTELAKNLADYSHVGADLDEEQLAEEARRAISELRGDSK